MDYFAPAPALRTHVSGYYHVRCRLPWLSDVLRADMGQIRFMLAGGGDYCFSDGVRATTPAIVLIGPTTGATRFDAIGPLEVFGIALLPAGWAALVRADAADLSDRIADARAVLGRRLDDAHDALGMALEGAAMVAIADRLMAALLAQAPEAPLDFTRITDAWLTGAPAPSVDELMRATGLSARQIERLANRIYGAPPKLLARKYRALRAVSVLATNVVDWRDLVADRFYDQSHMIREVKQFAGMTPGRIIRAPSPMTRVAFARARLVDELSPLAVLS